MASQSLTDGVTIGQLTPQTNWGDINGLAFLVQQFLNKVQTATLVRIEKCTNSGGLSPVGFVDVTPLVNQIDGQGLPTPHETIYNLPYFRIQGGANGIIIDPEVGDIGICVFASRDISKVKSTKAQANPGSRRMHSFSDGMYLGGVLNGVPSQYVQFSTAGIRIHSPTLVKLDAPDIQLVATTIEATASASVTITAPVVAINAATSATVTTPTFTVKGATVLEGTLSQTGGGAATLSGSLAVTGDITGQGTSLHTHTHSGVTTGTGNTGAPN